MVFMAALMGRFNPQIKGEITSGGGGVMEHVAHKRGWLAMVAWASQRHKSGGGGALLRPEVGDEVVGRLGRAGYEAMWVGVVGWWARWLGPAGRPRPKEWAGRLGWKRKEKGNPLKIDFKI
jgi:hypothetical protein